MAVAPGTRLGPYTIAAQIGVGNLRLAENLKGKLLLIHGTGDDAVPLGHTMRMVDALIKANKQFDLLIMPGETHGTFNLWGGYGLDAELRYFKEQLNP